MIDDCPKEKVRDVPASEILDKIQRGEAVEYDCVAVKGDLVLPAAPVIMRHAGGYSYGFEKKDIVSSEIKITNSKINGILNFGSAIFRKPVHFRGVEFIGDVYFIDAQFDEPIDFSDSHFRKYALFNSVKFGKDVYFIGSQFSQNAEFWESRFDGFAYFDGSEFNGDFLTFKNAIFKRSYPQEDACRRARNVLERAGNKEEAEYHFYREMEGRRKRKGFINRKYSMMRIPLSWDNIMAIWNSKKEPSKKRILKIADLMFGGVLRLIWYDIIEFIFVQKIFGYGVHPWWLMFWWGVIVIAFSVVYKLGNGLIGATQPFDYIKVSFATAIAPGYIAAIINPGSTGYRLISEYQAVAMAETIVGTFLWAGFIATFARKYMR